jgi:hypothetical protein
MWEKKKKNVTKRLRVVWEDRKTQKESVLYVIKSSAVWIKKECQTNNFSEGARTISQLFLWNFMFTF